MSSSIVVPNREQIANYPPQLAAAVISLATQAQNDINALQQAQIAGTSPEHLVQWATAAALPANTYSAAAKTLTANANGALSVDGGSPAVGDEILVKNEATGSNLGLYTVTATGSAGAKWVLTRTSDWNASASVQNDELIGVGPLGATNANLIFQVQFTAPFVLDTTAPAFVLVENVGSASGLTAGTTRTQGGALALTKKVNRIDTSTAPAVGALLGDGVALPASVAGEDCTVINNTANPIQVYGNGTDTINGVSGATGVAIPPKATEIFKCAAAGSWQFDAGVGAAGALPVVLSASGITAGTTRTQAGATVLAGDINRVDTSTAPAAGSTLGDGVALPASAAGLDIQVINNTANLIQVYGVLAGADTINGIAGATGVPVAPGDVAVFACAAAGAWHFDAGMGSAGALPAELAVTGVAAAGTTQGTATQLVAAMNKVTTATVGVATGIMLPAAKPGLDVVVENHSGTALQIFGNGTDTIDDVPTATGVTQMDSSEVLFYCFEPGKWYSNGLATGYAKNPTTGSVLETMQFADNLTAVGTTQATALQLLAAINTIATAAVGTGVNLPASAPGLSVIVQNNGANPILVYPAQGASDTINGVAAANGVSLHPGTAAAFNSTAAGAWTTQPVSPIMAAVNLVTSADGNINLSAAQISGGVAAVDAQVQAGVALTAGRTWTLPTVAALLLALHAPTVGTSYRLRITNAQAGAFAGTVTTNTGWTLTGGLAGSLAVPQNTWREFVLTITSITGATATLKSVANGTFS